MTTLIWKGLIFITNTSLIWGKGCQHWSITLSYNVIISHHAEEQYNLQFTTHILHPKKVDIHTMALMFINSCVCRWRHLKCCYQLDLIWVKISNFHIPWQYGINRNIMSKPYLSGRVFSYSYRYPSWYPITTYIPVQH
jgi:hypothetical protein